MKSASKPPLRLSEQPPSPSIVHQMQHSFQQMALKNRDAIQSAVEEHMSDQKHLRP